MILRYLEKSPTLQAFTKSGDAKVAKGVSPNGLDSVCIPLDVRLASECCIHIHLGDREDSLKVG
jgi:hypothetical protein